MSTVTKFLKVCRSKVLYKNSKLKNNIIKKKSFIFLKILQKFPPLHK